MPLKKRSKASQSFGVIVQTARYAPSKRLYLSPNLAALRRIGASSYTTENFFSNWRVRLKNSFTLFSVNS